MGADNTAEGLSILAVCIADVRQWYLQNGLQLNPDKSEPLIVGTTRISVSHRLILIININGRCGSSGG